MMVESREFVAPQLSLDLTADVVHPERTEYRHQQHTQPVTHLRQSQRRGHLLTPVRLADRSCTRPLRIIPLVLKPGKMPSYHNDLRGHCHGVTPFLLPTRSVGAHMALHHVASPLARAKR